MRTVDIAHFIYAFRDHYDQYNLLIHFNTFSIINVRDSFEISRTLCIHWSRRLAMHPTQDPLSFVHINYYTTLDVNYTTLGVNNVT